MRILLAALLVALLGFVAPGQAAAKGERITSFDSRVEIATDGTVTVTETITVQVAGIDIRHGIYRDFPTLYDGPWGLKEEVPFDVVSVKLDGRDEPWWTESLSNGVRVYIGDADRLVPRGGHVYTLVYRTGRQISFLENTDEFAWNVTGNDWAFPIERATARIVPPPGADAIEAWAYTGVMGSTATDATTRFEADGSVTFATTRGLSPGEGLTVAVTWPSGIVARPGRFENALGLLGGNLGLVAGLVGLGVTFVYFLLAWRRVGRDPQKGTVIALFEAPDGLSPVATGWVLRGGFGMRFSRNDAFAVAVTSLATKGVVTIEKIDDGFRIALAKEPPTGLPPGEAAALRGLFRGAQTSVELTGSYKPSVRSAVSGIASAVKDEYAGVYLRRNRPVWIVGAAIAALTGVVMVLIDGGAEGAVMTFVATVFAGAFAGAGALVLYRMGPRILGALRGQVRDIVPSLVVTVFALLFIAPGLASLGALGLAIAIPTMVVLFALIATVLVFLKLMEAPTRAGREVLDQIEGYRLYLSVAESDRMDWSANEPEMTPELFEHHLPYAMALGVAEAWATKFETMAGPEARQHWQPSWYRGSGGWTGARGLSSALASDFGGSISSAATAPSSRSGGSSFSGGGGSSGGGGGGGGGGGW